MSSSSNPNQNHASEDNPLYSLEEWLGAETQDTAPPTTMTDGSSTANNNVLPGQPTATNMGQLAARQTIPVEKMSGRETLVFASSVRRQQLTSLALHLIIYSVDEAEPRVWLTQVNNASGDVVYHVPVVTIKKEGDDGASDQPLTAWLHTNATPKKTVRGVQTVLCGSEEDDRLAVLMLVEADCGQKDWGDWVGGLEGGEWKTRKDLERRKMKKSGEQELVDEFLDADLREEVLKGFDGLGSGSLWGTVGERQS